MAAYTPNATWVEGGAPGISAIALNHLETQYSAAMTMALPLAGGTMSGAINFANANKLIQALTSYGLDVQSKENYLFLDAKLYLILLTNAYFDGTNWNRMDTGITAAKLQLTNDGTVGLYTAASGANPITWSGPYAVWHSNNAANGSLLTWSAGDYLIHTNATARTSTSATYVKLKESTISRGGTIRIAFDLTAQGGGTAYGRIYRNSVAVGTERSTAAGPTTFTEDISGWSAGDLVQVYGHNDGVNNVIIENLKLYVLYTDMANANASY